MGQNALAHRFEGKRGERLAERADGAQVGRAMKVLRRKGDMTD